MSLCRRWRGLVVLVSYDRVLPPQSVDGFIPAVTEPPGEFMYKWIGFSGLSASRKSSWATIEADTVSSTCPLRQIIRS